MNTPTLTMGNDYIIIESVPDSQAVAFSGVLGDFSNVISGTFTFSTDTSVAFAEGSGPGSYAYSAVHNEWVPVPPEDYTSVDLANTSVILTLDPEGFAAFSARYKDWFKLMPNGPATLLPLHSKGLMAVVSDADALHAWDPRVGRWAKIKVPVASMNNIQVKYGTAWAESDSTGYAFGLYDGLWDTVTINGNVVASDPGSGVGFIQTDHFLHVYTRSGSMATPTTYPESSRPPFLGGPLEISQVAAEGSLVYLFADFAPGYATTPWGTVFLQNLSIMQPLGPVPVGGVKHVNMTVPNDPLLIGGSFHLQNVIMPPSEIPYFTNSVSIVTM
jgi:hypothetical protein